MDKTLEEAYADMQRKKKALGLEVNSSHSILIEADNLTAVDRNNQYGSFFVESTKCAFIRQMLLEGSSDAWSEEEQDTLSMMVRKLVRHGFKKKRDNLVDLAGYAKLLQSLHETQHG